MDININSATMMVLKLGAVWRVKTHEDWVSLSGKGNALMMIPLWKEPRNNCGYRKWYWVQKPGGSMKRGFCDGLIFYVIGKRVNETECSTDLIVSKKANN